MKKQNIKKPNAFYTTGGAELQKLFASCLSEATGSLKEALAVKATLTDQSAALTAAQKQVQDSIDSKTDAANGNTASIEPELS